MARLILLVVGGLLLLSPVNAAESGRSQIYADGEVRLEGWLVDDGAGTAKRPGLLLLDESGTTSPVARQRAQAWAKQGYVVLVGDLFGNGVRSTDPKDARAKSPDRAALARRANLALAQLRRQPNVDERRLAVVGHGVGGAAALELARQGAEVEGVVCLHADLSGGDPMKAKAIRAELFIICGTEDAFGSSAAIEAFDAEMKAGGVTWQELFLGGVAAGFTHPGAGRNPAKGHAYDAAAERRAFEAARFFLAELFPKEAAASRPPPDAPKAEPKIALPPGVPAKVGRVLAYIDEHGEAPENHVGGRTFLNIEGLLPKRDRQGRPLRYQEWDVNPKVPGQNRGPERLVTGSDGTAYFTGDHYRSFKKIR